MGYWVSVRVKLHRNGFHICSQNIVPWLCNFCSTSQRKKEQFWSHPYGTFLKKKKNYPILVLLFLLLTSGESQLQSCNLFLIITIQQSNRDVMAAQSEKIDIPQCGSIGGTKWSQLWRKQIFYPLTLIVSHISLKEM